MKTLKGFFFSLISPFDFLSILHNLFITDCLRADVIHHIIVTLGIMSNENNNRALDFTLNDITHNILSNHNNQNHSEISTKSQLNKENDKKSMAAASSVEMSKCLEEKEKLVVRQREEIGVLKKFIEDVTNNKEYHDREEELKRQQ